MSCHHLLLHRGAAVHRHAPGAVAAGAGAANNTLANGPITRYPVKVRFSRKDHDVYRVRLFAVRRARLFEWIYKRVEQVMILLDPVFARIGYNRVERPIAWVEKIVKSLLFDCRMCGQCVLSSTGMSCPMNCPKQLRNGPCGGVRPGGYCEVKPAMKCVWALAWDGAHRMKDGPGRITDLLPPVDHGLQGSSSWLRVSREKAAQRRKAKNEARMTLARAFPEAREHEPVSAPLADEPLNATVEGQRK